VLIGQDGPAKIDIDAFTRRLSSREYEPVMTSLGEVGFPTAFSVLYTYAGWARDLQPWLNDAQINIDRNLRLQYLAGLVVNFTDADRIYSNFVYYRRVPDEVFIGSQYLRDGLRQALKP
jgi:spermidine synthase